jgi:hypothetical protein
MRSGVATSGAKTLCLVPHFFGPTATFVGGATSTGAPARRRRMVLRTVAQIKKLSGVIDPTVLIYGMAGRTLVAPDVDVSARVASPEQLLWPLFQDIGKYLHAYEYFLVAEDDILIPRSVIGRMIAAARDLNADEILFPNRLELLRGFPVVPDLYFLQQWTGYSRAWNGAEWHEAVNPNSGFLFMHRTQMAKVFERTDFSKPEIASDCFNYIDAAFCTAHRGFRLMRERNIIPKHYVFHQDSWSVRQRVKIHNAVKSHLARYGRKDLQWYQSPA